MTGRAEVDRREQQRSLTGVSYWLAIAAGIAFGVFIRRETLNFTFYGDDYAQLEMLTGHYALQRVPFDLFNFSSGAVEETRRLMAVGFYPWWSDPELRLAMLRPFASLMIWFDHRLFGNDPFGYHLHSVFWWCVMLAVVAMFYERVLPRRQALIAFSLLVCSVSLAAPFWWICNRSVLLTATLSMLSLLAYRRYRLGGSAVMLGVALALSSLAFAFGEYAFCALGYFFAYELCCGTGSLARRARSLAVVLLPALVFFIVRTLAQKSVRNSGIYLDPLGEPLEYIGAIFIRAPVLIADLMVGLQADHWTACPPWLRAWADAGWVPRSWLVDPAHWRIVHVSIGCVACVITGLIWRYTCRRPERRETQWLALGSVLSVLPVVASFPSSRLLVMAAIGFSTLLAAFILDGLNALRDAPEDQRARRTLFAAAACGLFAYQVVLPVMIQRSVFSRPITNGIAVRDAMLGLDVDEAALPGQDLILLSASDGGSSMYLPATRRANGRTVPRTCSYLSFAPAPYVLTRDAVNAFSIRYLDSTVMLHTALEQLFRAPQHRLPTQQPIDTGVFRATVLELYDGLPKSVRFEFDRPLESASLVFMRTEPKGFKRFQFPPLGGSVDVRAPAVPVAP